MTGTRYSISVSHMSMELVQFMSQLLNLMFIQIFTHVKFAENKVEPGVGTGLGNKRKRTKHF